MIGNRCEPVRCDAFNSDSTHRKTLPMGNGTDASSRSDGLLCLQIAFTRVGRSLGGSGAIRSIGACGARACCLAPDACSKSAPEKNERRLQHSVPESRAEPRRLSLSHYISKKITAKTPAKSFIRIERNIQRRISRRSFAAVPTFSLLHLILTRKEAWRSNTRLAMRPIPLPKGSACPVLGFKSRPPKHPPRHPPRKHRARSSFATLRRKFLFRHPPLRKLKFSPGPRRETITHLPTFTLFTKDASTHSVSAW